MTYYLTFMDTISLSRTDFEIFDLKLFRFRPRPLTSKCYLRSKNLILFESPYMTSYLISTDSISLFRTEIFVFKVFRGWPWPFTSEGHLGSNNFTPFESPYMTSYVTSWTPSLYLVPFSRYSTSKFLGVDLDLLPLKVIWGQTILHHSKARIWLPMWLHGHHFSISYRSQDNVGQNFEGRTKWRILTF